MSLEENLVWCTEIIGTNKFGEFPPGSVIAFNGARKYCYIYRPNKTKLRNNGTIPEISPEFLGLDDDEDDDDDQTRRAVLRMKTELPSWLDRLMDGTLPNDDKKRVDGWPQMEKLE